MEDILVGLLRLLWIHQFVDAIDLHSLVVQPLETSRIVGEDTAAAEVGGVIGQLPLPAAAHGEVVEED